MSSPSDVMPEEFPDSAPAAPANLPWTRTFYWSVRRELWENRAIYFAPLAAAGLALFGFLITCWRLPHAVRAAAAVALDPKKHEALMAPYVFTAFAVQAVGIIVVIFYSLSALHVERRDRSILFWKSLPVSDLTTVLSKAAIPLLVMPVVVLASIFGAELVILALSTVIVMLNGIAPQFLWSRLSVGFMSAVLAVGVPYLALWCAPVWAWTLLVSAWAKRMTFLWAVLPPMAVIIVERMALGKKGGFFTALFSRRLAGGFIEAFSVGGKGKVPLHSWADFDPARMFSNSGLWIGLAFAVAFLAAAVRLRRSREPI